MASSYSSSRRTGLTHAQPGLPRSSLVRSCSPESRSLRRRWRSRGSTEALCSAIVAQLAVALLGERDARLEHHCQRAQLALSGRTRSAARLRVAVPGAREAREAGATAVAMRSEHRADAALAVDVRTDDDPVRLHALKHRLSRDQREAVDGDA